MNRELLIEAVVSAHRGHDPSGRIQAAPEWHDLDAPDRIVAFDETLVQRQLEAAADPSGLSGTSRAVLARLSG